MRCIKCGKRSEEIYCEECYLEERPLIKSYKKINFVKCSECGRHLYRNMWVKDRIKDLIKESLIFDSRIEIDGLDYELNRNEIIVTINASHGKQKIKQSFSLPLNLVNKMCEDCSKKGQYFEAILQLREPREDIIRFIEREVEKQKNVFINEKQKVIGGIDFYLTSNKFAKKLGRKLQQNFGGELKISPRLHSKDKHTGKELYRLSVLFRSLGLRRGDIVSFDNKIIRVKGFAKKITGIDIINNKKVIIDYAKKKPELLEIYEAMVSKTFPSLEVIHPQTYQNVRVENLQKTTQKKLKVVIHNDKIYAI